MIYGWIVYWMYILLKFKKKNKYFFKNVSRSTDSFVKMKNIFCTKKYLMTNQMLQ